VPARASSFVIGSCLFVLGLLITSLLVCTAATYVVGRQVAREKQAEFLVSYRPPSWAEVMMALPMDYARRSCESNDVIFLGDSTCRAGIDPRHFTSCTGLQAYNLGGMFALGVDGMRLILQSYLDYHPAPRLVVVSLHPSNFGDSQPPELQEAHTRFLECYGGASADQAPSVSHSFGECLTLGRRKLAWWATGHIESGRGYPISDNAGFTYLTAADVSRRARGFLDYSQNGGQPGRIHADGWQPRIDPSRIFWPGMSCRKELSQLYSIAQQRGAGMLIRLAPLPYEPFPVDQTVLDQWFHGLEADCPGVVVCEPLVTTYSMELFYDAFHLNQKGARQFTARIANDAQTALAVEARAK
jgi:hypothetical protein